MRVLVFGGTGTMGAPLVSALAAQGYEVFSTTRSKRESSLTNVHYLEGNAHDMEFLGNILKEFHYDAIVDFMIYEVEEFRERLHFLLSATNQYVFLSSSRVYAGSDEPITEESPRLLEVSQDKNFLATDDYALKKAKEEDLLRNSGKYNWTIVRPYITYNNVRLQLGIYEKEQWLYRALNGRTIVLSSDVASRVTTLTYGLDVAETIVKLIGNSKAIGEAVHIATSESLVWSNILNIYLDIIEEKIKVRPNVFFTHDGVKGSTYKLKYDRLFNRVFDNKKVDLICGESINYTSTEVGLKKCLEEFIDGGCHFKPLSGSSEARMDKVTKEITPLKAFPSTKEKIKYLIVRLGQK